MTTLGKKYFLNLVTVLFIFTQGCVALLSKGDSSKPGESENNNNVQVVIEGTPPPTVDTSTYQEMNGVKVMTLVSERDRGQDHTISTSWKMLKGGREEHTMKYFEMRKNYRGEGSFDYKSVIRYTHPPSIHRRAILIWDYKNRERLYWYFLLNFRDARRTTNIESLQPPAESDFSFVDYIDIDLEDEQHTLLKTDLYKGSMSYVVESIPTKRDIKFGKRVSWIDQEYFMPRKIEYYNKRGKLWKVLTIVWQHVEEVWFWKQGMVENVQSGHTTIIIFEDV